MKAFHKLNEVEPHVLWHGAVARTVHAEQMTLALVDLDPNLSVPEHAHVNEQVGLVIAGSLTLTVGEETRELGPGDAYVITGNVRHSVLSGDAGATVLDVFAPTREDWAGLPRSSPTRGRWP